MRSTALKVVAWGAAGAVLLCMAVLLAVLVAANTGPGRALIETLTARLTGGMVRLSGLDGSFPGPLTLEHLEIRDRQGIWLSADGIAITWSPLELLERRISVDRLEVERLDVERRPQPEGATGGTPNVPHIEVAAFTVREARLGPALAGRAARLSLRGGVSLRSLRDAHADLTAKRLDGDGDYALRLSFDPQRMDGRLSVHEPASGPLENILQLPGLGALSADLTLAGPRAAEHLDLELAAGTLGARAQGTVDLAHESLDLKYSAHSAAVSPRPDLKWCRLSLDGEWHGTLAAPAAAATLQIDGLELPGGVAIAALQAALTGARDAIAVHGTLAGLRVPGPAPALFGKEPVAVDASMRLAEAGRPLTLRISHRLLSASVRAVTAGKPSAAIDARVPDIAPFALLAGQTLAGRAAVKAQLDDRADALGFTLAADFDALAGPASWVSMIGPHATLGAAGAVSAERFSLERAELKGRTLALGANGSALKAQAGPGGGRMQGAAAYIGATQLHWQAHVADLGALTPQLAGPLQASGAITGTPAVFSADADAEGTLSIRGSAPGRVAVRLRARGLPSAPSADIEVRGMLDGAPLALAATLERGGRELLHASIRRGEWKSVHAQGELALTSSMSDARGHLRLHIGQLADLDRLLGADVRGRVEAAVEFTPRAGRTHAYFELDGSELVLGALTGTVHLAGDGDTRAVAAQLHVESPDLAGFPAQLAAAAKVDLDARSVRADEISIDYRGLKAVLAAPATVSYADGLTVDRLALQAQGGRLEFQGRILPSLDARASLQHVGPALIGIFLPDLIARGTLEGSATLRGPPGAPSGRVDLHAAGIRFTDDQALGLPALDATALAELEGDTAALDVRLNAGTASSFTMSGEAPLNAQGVFDLKLAGKLDLAMANPMFEARGMHVGGNVAIDASLAGKPGAPQITGSVTLAQGSFRDYVRGTNLTDITAQVDGSQGTLQIRHFKATAASGSLSASGSIGVLQPKLPVDLKITASKAQLLSSSIVTANMNADLGVQGTALERLLVRGSIHVNRAVIGIPDSLPPNVAVLDVRRRGQHVRPPSGKPLQIDLDVSLDAPREILVQGRGLDAELGGELRIRGTTDAPRVSGKGFDLVRGNFSLAGRTLVFDPSSHVSFDGAGLKKSIDPSLDFTASTTVQVGGQSTQISLHIGGYADAPRFEFSSVPPVGSQDELMALLLFGQPASQLSALQVAQVGAALASVSGVGGGGANPLTRLQKSLGLDRLSVGANTVPTATGGTETQGAAIQAGRYISRRVYVEGRQNTTGTSQVQVDVDLTKHLKLTTRLGNGTAIQGTTPDNDPGSSIGLSYQIEY